MDGLYNRIRRFNWIGSDGDGDDGDFDNGDVAIVAVLACFVWLISSIIELGNETD